MAIHHSTYKKYDGASSITPLQQIWRITANEYIALIRPASAKGMMFLGVAGYSLLGMLFFFAGAFNSYQYDVSLSSYATAFAEIIIQYLLIYQYIVTVFLFIVIGADIISKDFQNHMLSFYFSKPINVREYIAGKLFALALIPISVCFFPVALLQFIRTIASLHTPYFSAVLLATFWTLLYEVCFALIYAGIMLALSALTRHKSWAVFLWVMLAIVPLVISIAVSNMERPYAQELSDYLYIPGLILLSIDIAGSDWFQRSLHTFIGPLLFLLLGVLGVWFTYHKIKRASTKIIQ